MTSSFPPEPRGSETNKHYTKTIIRKQMLAKRSLVLDRMTPALKVKQQIIATEDWKNASKIGFYWPKIDELSTIPLINAGWSEGKQCFLPKMSNQEMLFHKFNSILELEITKNSIMEPRCDEIGNPELIIVPCLAVTKYGFRIGYGKGIYDRYLEHNKTKTYVIAYIFQEIKDCRPDSWDIACDKVFLA